MRTGEQVLVGAMGTVVVMVQFRPDGAFEHAQSRDISDNADASVVIRKWLREIGAVKSQILVHRFALPELHIGITDLPQYLQEVVDNPDGTDPGRMEELLPVLNEWRRDGQYVLLWDEEYFMDANGRVDST